MRFEITLGPKRLIFDSDLHGLRINGVDYLSGRDGVLIYDKTRDIRSDVVEMQMSTNTSALIPALRALGIPYASYFDERPVVESQNDITFYWKPSQLAAFYNRYSTDELDYTEREPVIRRAVDFITSNPQRLPLPEELLRRMLAPSTLLGFYEGFPIFDGSTGFARLQSRLGIHIDTETVMISTPLDKYEADVYELADKLEKETGLEPSKKKNRVMFMKEEKLLRALGLSS
ncbi:MAG: hypothetical protein C3F07_08150 [Anaerolineales bacterium]|nr:hypothetical protein [Anaerolineae bacterium]PWB74251.1 MAG: hypothetical protein C3F07_08150 [Anaerolineales bacterium]